MKTKILFAAMLLSISMSLFAQTSGTCGENLTWKLSNGVLTISGTGYMDNYNSTTDNPWYSKRTQINSIIISDGVESIGPGAFHDCSNLTSVTIGNSLISIGYNAFSSCSSLTSINLPNSLTSIGMGAFSSCSSLTSIEIPNSVTSIESYAFSGCGVTSIEIPNSVTSILEGTFYSCSSLTNVTIHGKITGIGQSAFFECSKIKTIKLYAETPPRVYTTSDNISKPAFYGVPISSISLSVPQQWIPLYKYDTFWKQFNIQGLDASESQFTITWKNYDGSVLETDENVAFGTIPTYDGETPVKPADDQYIYTFAGWSPLVVTTTGNATYTATFTATFKVNTHIIHVNQDCTSYMEEQQ